MKSKTIKILQINNVYRNGSTGKITFDIHTGLKKMGYSSVVCYGRGDLIIEPDVYKTCGELYSKFNNLLSRFTGVMYGGCWLSTNKLISTIKREKPDIVHLHCINGYFVNVYKLIEWLKINQIPTVLTLHAEFIHTANCGYALDCDKWKTGCGQCPRLRKETKSLFLDGTHKSWMKMKKAFEGFNENLIVASVSPWLMDRAEFSPILADKRHVVVMNGLDTSVFHIYNFDKNNDEHHLKGKKIIFHATPKFNLDPNHIKGGYYVNELAKRFLGENVAFLVAGEYDKNALYSDNIIFLGKVKDQKVLAYYYSVADLTLLTSKKETFSMVTAESLCCGTPVVGFMAGAPEMIALSKYSKFVEWSNIDKLEGAIRIMLKQDILNSELEYQAHQKYSTDAMTSAYAKLYSQIL